MKRISRAVLVWVVFCGWFGLLAYLSSRQVPKGFTLPIPHFDKIVHFGFFAVGGGILAVALVATFGKVARSGWFTALVFMAAIGLSDEVRQLFTPGRTGADPLDFLADMTGATLGLGIVAFLHARIRNTRP